MGKPPREAPRTAIIKMTRPPGTGLGGSGPLLFFDVLGVEEDGQWSAIALDMSIADYGDTFDEALNSLTDAVKAQIEFAFSDKGGEQLRSTLFMPAEGRYFKMFRDARRNEMFEVVAAILMQRSGERMLLPSLDSQPRRPERRFRCPLALAEL